MMMTREALTLLSVLLTGTLGMARADTLKMECDTRGPNSAYCEYIKQRFEAETPHQLQFVSLPTSTTEKWPLLQQVFIARDGYALDLLLVDTIWLGLLDPHLLDLTAQVRDMAPDFIPSAWQSNIVHGRIKAIPDSVTAGMLYYRQDLLEKYDEQPPQTWTELERIARRIQAAERASGHPQFWGLLIQGKLSEALTCNALEWVASHQGGSLVEDDGRISANNPRAAKALDTAAGWIGSITPTSALEYTEESALALFQKGDALFMRHWPDAYLQTQEANSLLRGKVGVVPLPRGEQQGQHAATLGGWQWAVSAYSRHPEAAIQLLRLLTDAKTQKMAFMLRGSAPGRLALYDDPDILARAPHLRQFKQIFAAGIARPSHQTGSHYMRVSKAIYNAAYDVLSGRIRGKQAVAELESTLQRLKGSHWQ